MTVMSVIVLLALAALVFLAWPVVPRSIAEAGTAFREGVRDWWPHAALIVVIVLLVQTTP